MRIPTSRYFDPTSGVLAKAQWDREVRITGKNEEGITAVLEISFGHVGSDVGVEALGNDRI